MNRYKRTVAIILSVAVILTSICGCSKRYGENIIMQESQSENDEYTVDLSFLGYKADSINLIAIEKMLHGFMDINPDINVTYEGIKGMAYWDAFYKRVSSGNMNDIIMVDHDRILELTKQNALLDLSELISLDDFEPMVKTQIVSNDGAVYFIPTCISTYGLYINLDLLEEHNQKVPENLSEFTEVCDYFVSQGVTPIVANNYASLKNLMIAKSMYPIYQKENPKEEIIKFNRGEADIVETLRPGIEMVKMMIDRKWFDCDEVLITKQTSDDLKLFAEGERPFMITGGWASMRVSAIDPEINFKIYPFPVLDDGSVLVENVDTCVSINADSDHLEEAKKLVQYLAQKDAMWEYCDSQNSFTPMKDDRMPSDTTVEPSAKQIKTGPYVIGSDYDLELPLDSALMECGNQLLKGMDVESAINLISEMLAK